MTLQNVTVIIPAHNRPERLRRLLDYYSRTDIKVLVPDSSDHPFADAEKYPDITYLHRPKLHFLLKLKEVLPMISTPYPLAELNKRIFKSANRFVVNVVYILKDCKCTYFP